MRTRSKQMSAKAKSKTTTKAQAQAVEEAKLDMPELIDRGLDLPSLHWLQSTFKTKSAVIRYLFAQGHSVKTIAKHTGFRYQHVRNVLTTNLKRGPNEPYKLDPATGKVEEAHNIVPTLQTAARQKSEQAPEPVEEPDEDTCA